MQAAANRRGINLPSRARQISLDDFSSFDLVLTMDDDNLAPSRDWPRSRATSNGSIKPMLSYAGRFSETEVPDPYYGGEAGFEHVLDLLEDACANLLDEIKPRRRRPGFFSHPRPELPHQGIDHSLDAHAIGHSSTASSACTRGATSRVLSRWSRSAICASSSVNRSAPGSHAAPDPEPGAGPVRPPWP